MNRKLCESFMLFGEMTGALGVGLTGCGPLILKSGTAFPCGVALVTPSGEKTLKCLGYDGPCTCTREFARLHDAASRDFSSALPKGTVMPN